MKKSLLFLIFILQVALLKAQNDKPRFLKLPTVVCPIDITKSYSEKGLFKGNSETIMIKEDSSVIQSIENLTNKKVSTKQYRIDTLLLKGISIEGSYAFNIIKQVGSFTIIKFWDLSSATAKSLIKELKSHNSTNSATRKLQIEEDYGRWTVKGLVAKVDADTVDIDLSKAYYILPTSVLLKNSTEFEDKTNTWNIGILALPIKIRPFATEKGQFDFTSGYSFGTTLAWTLHHNWKTNFTHNVLIYAGISSYTADSIKIKEKRDDYKIPTFSPGIGWMWERKNVQLSLLMGIDFPSGNLQKNWVYRNKPWFGIGIGIGLFKIDSQASAEIGKN